MRNAEPDDQRPGDHHQRDGRLRQTPRCCEDRVQHRLFVVQQTLNRIDHVLDGSH